MAAKGGNRTRRPKWHFRCIAAFSIAVAGFTAINIVTTSAGVNVTTGQTSQALSAGAASSAAAITAREEVLPSHVYVLNNREVVTEKPSPQSDQLVKTAEEPFSLNETASRSATIKASVTVASSRLIVVDENDTIIEIWSNTTGLKRSFYSLRVKEQSWQGLEHPLTQTILAQYNRLLGEVDWSINGRAYSAPIY